METEAAELPPTPPEPPPLRLSILHLLMWMTGSAVLLALRSEEGRFQLHEDSQAWEEVLAYVLAAGMAINGGVALASLGMLVQFGFRRSSPFPRHPGHWILIALGLTSVVRIGGWLYEMYGMPRTSNYSANIDRWLQVQLVTFMISLFVRGVILGLATKTIDARGWRILFKLSAAAHVLFAAVTLIAWSETLAAKPKGHTDPMLSLIYSATRLEHLIFPAVCFVLMLAEWRRKRDLMHYVGLIVLYVIALQWLAHTVWYWISFELNFVLP